MIIMLLFIFFLFEILIPHNHIFYNDACPNGLERRERKKKTFRERDGLSSDFIHRDAFCLYLTESQASNQD